jgi:hypothetical protein
MRHVPLWVWNRVRDLLVALGLRRRMPSAAGPGIVAVVVEEEPETLDIGLAYMVGGSDPIYTALVCPCGCGAALRMNLRPEAEPCWQWRVAEKGAVTLSPSVWRHEGCRSHFFLRKGRVVWCDSP